MGKKATYGKSGGVIVRSFASRSGKPVDLLADVRDLILAARQTVARGVNVALVRLYWQIGQRIRNDLLQQERAKYGEEILPTLSAKLMPEFGEGFSVRNLARMISFAEAFPEQKIVTTLSQYLGWSHFVELLPLRKHLQRDFYFEMCRIERWSVRTLRKKIGACSMSERLYRENPINWWRWN